MGRAGRTWWRCVIVFSGCCGAILVALRAPAAALPLKDGRVLEGELGMVNGLAQDPFKLNPDDTGIRLIMFADDNLRRTFVPKTQVAGVPNEAPGAPEEKIHVHQRVAIANARIAKVGPIIKTTAWDQFGRRTLTMSSDRGAINVIQGITEITPTWTRVEALAQQKQNFQWDMRIATSSIPRETLRQILVNRKDFDAKKLENRLQIVRLLLQSERFQEAQKELEAVIVDFPTEQRLQREVQSLRQVHAKRIIDEIKQRRSAGQHRLAYAMLERFPKDDVSGETLAQVKDLVDQYADAKRQGERVLKQLEADRDAIDDSRLRERAAAIHKEISEELGINTLDRMADYLRLIEDPQLKAEERFSLAVSGWLLGSNAGGTNLVVSLSLVEVRNLIREYLREPGKLKRDELLRQLKSQEGSTPKLVAQLIAHMKPPIETEPPAIASDSYELQIPGFDQEPPVNYLVQRPPEYDPARRYPAIVTLHGAGTSSAQQDSWWAGDPAPKGDMRLGQASRHGYIVIAVDWAKEGQVEYEYSAREHAAVLGSLRDACRRFSIDTDRVFLSGHSMGGDAAWDIGLAHPDLWAGLIPIVAVADKYCTRYWENAKTLPCYVVAGELDGDKVVKNAERLLDRILKKGYDVTVVEYQGRGHEDFHDEIQRLFDWMGRKERNFFPKDCKTTSMRSWDNFFWWLEIRELPPRAVVDPVDWPPKRGYQPANIEAAIKGNNITVSGGADKVTIWLSPELIDFDRRMKISIKGKPLSLKDPLVEPNLSVLLEDVRTRGERLHPFWVKIE